MASSIVIGGASGAADLKAVLQVAQGQPISLDVATADRIKKESPPPKDFKQETDNDALPHPVGPSLARIETRASILCRLISLANGSTKLRLAVVQYLVELLNSGIQLQLVSSATDAEALRQLADAAAGTGQAVQNGKSTELTEALEHEKLSAPGLSQQERNTMQTGQWITIGVAAVTMQKAKHLLLGATAVAALSAEALQAQVSMLAALTCTCKSSCNKQLHL